jgi:hypothetical protein
MASKSTRKSRSIRHTDMVIPLFVNQLLTMMVDGQPVRMQVTLVPPTYNPYGIKGFDVLKPVDRDRYFTLFPKGSTVSLDIPGVEIVTFHMQRTSEAFEALKNCQGPDNPD